MAYNIALKRKAANLREKGFSLSEIVTHLHIAKSTASQWVSYIELSPNAQRILAQKQILGQYKTVLIKRKLKESRKQIAKQRASESLQKVTLSKDLFKLCCSLLWWCEGNKNTTYVRFTNSDPSLIKNFLFLLRNGFSIDESKFRVLVHLHDYHSEEKQKKFWSDITGIKQKQFYKSYRKPNTGIRHHENYQGCIAISYYDAKIAKELEGIYNVFSNNNQGVFVNG